MILVTLEEVMVEVTVVIILRLIEVVVTVVLEEAVVEADLLTSSVKSASSMVIDVAPCGACRPWIFFINGFLCFLRSDCSGMEKEKDEWRCHFK